LPRFSAPIPSTTTKYLLRQDFLQFKNQFSDLALNTAHPDYGSYVLVGEGELQDQGGGVVKWERTYAAVPASHDEFESFAYSFIAFAGLISSVIGGMATATGGFADTSGNVIPSIQLGGATGGSYTTGRPRFTRTVNSRLQHDYFLVGAAQTYATAGAIPSIPGLQYYVGGLAEGQMTDCLIDAVGWIPASVPTRTQYKTWMAAAVASGWGGAVATLTTMGSQFVAEDSTLRRWQGNIWLRQTRYILAI
jgi:hypothetical protein